MLAGKLRRVSAAVPGKAASTVRIAHRCSLCRFVLHIVGSYLEFYAGFEFCVLVYLGAVCTRLSPVSPPLPQLN